MILSTIKRKYLKIYQVNQINIFSNVLIFKLRDKRKIDNNISLEEIKNKLINAEKTRILNMHAISHYDKVLRSISIKYLQ